MQNRPVANKSDPNRSKYGNCLKICVGDIIGMVEAVKAMRSACFGAAGR